MALGRWAALAVAACVATTTLGGGIASGAGRPQVDGVASWRQAVATPPPLAAGCYDSTYPSVAWRPVPCQVAPALPMTPAAVGDGKDWSAVVSGRISSATGAFADVDRAITEAGPYGKGTSIPNVYSLQLNSQFFSTPVCSGAKHPADCLGWEQFVYDSHAGLVFMQYWLIDYKATCPTHWMGFQGDCYRNSAAGKFAGGRIPAVDLADTTLTGSASSGGRDEVTLASGGQATTVSGADTVVDLAGAWDTAEFNVFGDGDGSQATFDAGTTLESTTSLRTTSAKASCVKEGFTAETNNLDLTHTPAPESASSPTVAFEQVSSGASGASCATAG